ncbi:hypothetical protein ACICHK_39135 [Streptomyces sp. AHU1]|uniref:hypothetical protein n=1 Tax=Streptomyces sp. AHU1 TaxID=3377215 RepID=UPI0038783F9B
MRKANSSTPSTRGARSGTVGNEIQAEVNPRLLSLGMPMTQRAIDAFQATTALACFLRIPDLAARLSKEDRGGNWQLPENPAPTSII